MLRKFWLILGIALALWAGKWERLQSTLSSIDAMIIEESNISDLNGTLRCPEENGSTSSQSLPSIRELTSQFSTKRASSTSTSNTASSSSKAPPSSKGSWSHSIPSPPPPAKEIHFIAAFIGEDGKRAVLTAQGELLQERDRYKGCLIETITLLQVQMRCGKRHYSFKVGKR
ncbi:MAG: hypothetical protein C6I00_02905 [Nitratiruptor sp.]|nr:hypothetical protein [Nitratiruptor sp.]